MQSLHDFCFEPGAASSGLTLVVRLADFGVFLCLQCACVLVLVPVAIGIAAYRVATLQSSEIWCSSAASPCQKSSIRLYAPTLL